MTVALLQLQSINATVIDGRYRKRGNSSRVFSRSRFFDFCRAQISLMCGDADTALMLLDRSLQTPAGITVPELRPDPTWEPLRSDRRFQQMLTKYGGTG